MDDLEKQLEEYGARAADEVEPVTAEQARDRAAAGGGGVADVVGSGVVTSGSEGSAEVVLAELDGERRSRWHTVLAVAAVVLVLALVGGALALRDDEPNDLVTEPAPSDDPTFGYGPGWHDLDPGPLSGRTGVAVAWTGTELIVVGGTTVDRSGEPQVLRDGAAYDPATRTWRSIPALPARGAPGDGPEAGGARLEAIWTGTEMLVVEISALSLASRPRGNARYVAAFDPATDTWRVTASWTEGELMSVGAADFALHWTGSEVLFADALVAYDPATDEFRELTTPADRDSEATGQDETWFELLVPEHPRRSVWTGDELLLFDAYATDGGVTIAIDPDTLERRRLEPRPGIPPAPSRPVDNIGDAVWTGSSLVDVNARGDEVATFDPSSEGGWRLGELPAASTP